MSIVGWWMLFVIFGIYSIAFSQKLIFRAVTRDEFIFLFVSLIIWSVSTGMIFAPKP